MHEQHKKILCLKQKLFEHTSNFKFPMFVYLRARLQIIKYWYGKQSG